MTELQEHLLNILKWYHQFCLEHKLKYYAIGGTLLGAIRHKGFIPWDDDIDVGMPRGDYIRFLNLIKEENIAPFAVEAPGQCQDDYIYPFAKIYDTRTTLIENTRKDFKRGVYIDLFPVDGVGKTKFKEVLKYLLVRFLFNFLRARTVKVEKKRSIIKTLFIKSVNLINVFDFLDKVFPLQKLLILQNEIYTKEDYEESKSIGNLVWGYGWREHVDKNAWGTPREYPFENTVILGHQNYNVYLKALFGDYMTLPPEDKRKVHAPTFVDFNKSYSKRNK